jgi:hypothetical protein
VPGSALRLESSAFLEVSASGRLHEVIQLYTLVLFTQISQAAACNRLHLTEERFARWLLMTHDRVESDEFTLTQDFLSQMLGVRRATVSQIASKAQADGVIRYARGCMTILDRERLEEMTCECYGIIRAEFERLLGKPRVVPDLRLRPPLPTLSDNGRSTAGDGTPRQRHEEQLKRRPRR